MKKSPQLSLLFLLMLSFAPKPTNAQLNPAVAIATGVLGKIGAEATNQVMIKMGMDPTNGVLPAINKLESGMNEALGKLDDIRKQIANEAFTDAYVRAKGHAIEIQSKVSSFSTWEANITPMDGPYLRSFQDGLISLRDQLDHDLNDETSGLFVKLMALQKDPAVTDLNSYWASMEYFRDYFTLALAKATLLMQAVADLQQKKWEECNKGKSAATTVQTGTQFEFVGTDNTSCRAGFNNEGAPNDPLITNPNNNKYYEVKTYNTLQACQDACLATPGCTGVEYQAGTSRCELWKVPIVKIQPSSYGYTCREKKQKTTQTTGLSTSNEECNNKVPRLAQSVVDGYTASVIPIYRKMYTKWGVPMMENRNKAKFVHLKGEPWALSPKTDFSGYYGTSDGRRLLDKLLALAKAYRPADNGGKTLEQFLDANQVPTRYVDQASWKVDSRGAMNTKAWNVSVRADMVVGNAIQSKEILLWDGGDDGPKAYADAEMIRLKSAAGQTSGLLIPTYWDEICRDCTLCTCPGRTVNVNKTFYGRFFTYNLTGEDCARLLKEKGATSKEFQYCSSRLNPAGRAALMNETAVNDYLKMKAGN